MRLFLATERKDAWWVPQLLTFLGFSAFIVYATWAAFQNAHYWLPNTGYLSPFYSPELFGDSPHAWFGPKPAWWPGWAPFSPAFLILWAPGGFRFTCYYYRGAYYKSFWADPPACAVGEPRKSALLLRLDHGLAYEDIAEVMGWSVAKVKNEIHRARLQLRAQLARYLGGSK